MNRTGNSKIAVVGWGRGMGHQGHMYLADAVIQQAQDMNADPYFFVSKTVGKDDPIYPEEKVRIYQKVFPQYANIFEPQGNLNGALKHLADLGYTGVVVVVGADQLEAFKYLERADKTGHPVYQSFGLQKLRVISRQQTRSKFAQEEGPRATPMREVLLDPNVSDEERFKVWRRDMPKELGDADVRDVMHKAESRLLQMAKPKPTLKPKAAKKDTVKTMSKKQTSLTESEIADQRAKVYNIAHMINTIRPSTFTRFGDEYMFKLIEKIAAAKPNAHELEIGADVFKHLAAVIDGKEPMDEARIFQPTARVNLYYHSPRTGNYHVLAHNIPYSVVDKYVQMLRDKGYDFTPNDVVARPIDATQYTRSSQPDLAEGKFNELSVMIADYHNMGISDVKFYGMYGMTRQEFAKKYASYLEEDQLNEFAPGEGGGSRKFLPWNEFIGDLEAILGDHFAVKQNVVKNTIKARFIPHDPMEFGPTMLYSYYETRGGGRNKGAISTRGSIQVGKYTRGGLYGQPKDQLLTMFNLLKGHPFERHFDLTGENVQKIADIIIGNTQGALEFQPQQQVNEFSIGNGDDREDGPDNHDAMKRLAAAWWNGDEDPRVEKALRLAGWDIGQDEGYEGEPGVYVIQRGDETGNSYMSWSADELRGLEETKVSKYKDLGATNATTHFIKNVTTGKVVSPHRGKKDAEDALVAHYRTPGGDEHKIVRARKGNESVEEDTGSNVFQSMGKELIKIGSDADKIKKHDPETIKKGIAQKLEQINDPKLSHTTKKFLDKVVKFNRSNPKTMAAIFGFTFAIIARVSMQASHNFGLSPTQATLILEATLPTLGNFLGYLVNGFSVKDSVQSGLIAGSIGVAGTLAASGAMTEDYLDE